MLFFNTLLKIKEGAVAGLRNKRKATRYPVGPGFPLSASINLTGEVSPAGDDRTRRPAGCNWGGRLINLSSDGASLHLPPAAATLRGEQTTLTLTIEGRALQIPCRVAHYRTYSSHALCGLVLDFTDAPGREAYLQLVESVALGSTFATVKPSRLGRTPPGLEPEQYRSPHEATLTAWRAVRDRTLDSFELLSGEHCVRGVNGAATLEIYSQEAEGKSGKVALSAPSHGLATGVNAEVRQFYRWIVPNLPKAVPADLREFMQRFMRKTDVAAAAWARP
jgi:PilZ domain